MSRWKLNSKQPVNFIWNFDCITLEMCGLDPFYNILEAPECQCGCGSKVKLCLETDDEVLDFCKAMVYEEEYDYCAVFAINKNNTLLAAIGDDEKIYICRGEKPIDDYKSIGKMFDEMQLDGYGLIVYSGDGLYKIVE